jgi:hypothetical protein
MINFLFRFNKRRQWKRVLKALLKYYDGVIPSNITNALFVANVDRIDKSVATVTSKYIKSVLEEKSVLDNN